MIVLDASAAAGLLLDLPSGLAVADRVARASSVDVPAQFDFEMLSTLRKLTLRDQISSRDARLALSELGMLTLRRWSAREHLERAFELRHTIGAGDALYVALAESLDAPLVTVDARLARSHGHHATIELVA